MYKWWHCARVIVCTARTSLQKGRMGVSEGRPLWRRMKGSSHVSTARDYDVVISQFLYVPSRLSLSTAMTHCPSVHSAASPPDLCPLPRTSGRRHSLPVTPRPISFAHARGRPRAGRGAANVRRVPPYFRRPWWYRRRHDGHVITKHAKPTWYPCDDFLYETWHRSSFKFHFSSVLTTEGTDAAV